MYHQTHYMECATENEADCQGAYYPAYQDPIAIDGIPMAGPFAAGCERFLTGALVGFGIGYVLLLASVPFVPPILQGAAAAVTLIVLPLVFGIISFFR